jgi:hypothetical protein
MPQRVNEKIGGSNLIQGLDVNTASPRIPPGTQISNLTVRNKAPPTPTHNDLVFNFTHCWTQRSLACPRLRVRILLGRADHSSGGVLPAVMPQRVNEETVTHWRAGLRPLAC